MTALGEAAELGVVAIELNNVGWEGSYPNGSMHAVCEGRGRIIMGWLGPLHEMGHNLAGVGE